MKCHYCLKDVSDKELTFLRGYYMREENAIPVKTSWKGTIQLCPKCDKELNQNNNVN